MSIVRITDLFKEYGKGDASVKAVNHVSLAIEKGEFLTIVGTSGSGKTTLLNLMGGLDYPDGGKVVIEGQDITGMKSDDLTIFRRKKIGFIFQNYNLISSLNIRENILLTIKLDNKRADRDFLDTVVETLGLQDKLNRYPNQLSGGQQQRTAIARALISKPAIILADNLNYASNSKNILFVSLIGGCFTIITVLSGCSRSFYTVSRISPVEAAHYGGKKCGRLFSRLSLGLSIIIFLLVFTVAGSQDARKEAKRYHTTDFTIENRSVHPLSESSYSPIDREVCGALKRAGFVETMDVCYNARSLPDYVTEENGEKTYDLTARVRPDEKIERESNEVARLYGEDDAKITYKGDWKIPLMGIPGSVLAREMKGKEVADGMIDEKEFAKGNYIIFLSVIILLVISCVTSLCLVKFLNRRSIVERLRCDE